MLLHVCGVKLLHGNPDQVSLGLVHLGEAALTQLWNLCLVLQSNVNTPGELHTETQRAGRKSLRYKHYRNRNISLVSSTLTIQHVKCVGVHATICSVYEGTDCDAKKALQHHKIGF